MKKIKKSDIALVSFVLGFAVHAYINNSIYLLFIAFAIGTVIGGLIGYKAKH